MPQLIRKPLSWFKINPQVRKQFDEAGLKQLGESLKVKQLQPVLARPDGTLIAGERRYRAAMLVGMNELEVIITEEPLTESQIRVLQLTENMQREDLSGYEQWQGCVELLRLNPGWLAKDLAQSLKLDPSMVTRLQSPSKCIAEVQKAFAAGEIGISDCYTISKLAEGEQAEALALKLSGASRDQLEQHGRKKRNGPVSAVRVNRIKCPLPSGAVVMISGEGISLDEAIGAAQEWVKAAKRAVEDGLDAKTFQAVCKDRAKKNGV
jgi:ParB/RepB/Spo0J family partition protein